MRSPPPKLVLVPIAFAGLIVAACSSPALVPAPTATPTATPEPTATSAAPAPSPTTTQRALTPTPTPSTESVIQYVTAYAYLDRGDFVQAERYFDTVIDLEPTFARGWDGRGQARLFKGDYQEAMLDFDRAILLKPNLAQAYSHRAFARMASGDFGGALRDAEKALSINDLMVDPYIVLGRVLTETGRLSEALVNFDRAVSLAPVEGGVYWWRGRFYRDAVGDIPRALLDMDKAVEFDPARASFFLDRAITRIYAAAPPAAVRADLEEAISLSEEPRLPDIIARAEELLELVKKAEATGSPVQIPRS